jgi:hypothetical protein
MKQVFDFFLSPTVIIGLLSLISAVLILYVFKKVSNQEKIKLHKDRVLGHILETYLYRDQFVQTILSQLHILKHNMLYLRYILVPLLVVTIPMLIVMTQIHNRFGYAPLEENEQFIIHAELDQSMVSNVSDFLNRIHCETSGGIRIETPPVRIASESSISWRARVLTKRGLNHIRLNVEGSDDVLERLIVTNLKTTSVIPQKVKRGLLRNIVSYNAEEPIPEGSPFKRVSVSYRPARYGFLFWRFDPVVLFILFTLCISLIIKPFFNVRI